MGSVITATTEEYSGGKSCVQLSLRTRNTDLNAVTINHVLSISGNVEAGFTFPWSGLAYMLGANMQGGVDLLKGKYWVFDAKGDNKTKQTFVLLFQEDSLMPLQINLEINPKWTTYKINLDRINKLDRSNISNISIVRSQILGEFTFEIEDLRFE